MVVRDTWFLIYFYIYTSLNVIRAPAGCDVGEIKFEGLAKICNMSYVSDDLTKMLILGSQRFLAHIVDFLFFNGESFANKKKRRKPQIKKKKKIFLPRTEIKTQL